MVIEVEDGSCFETAEIVLTTGQKRSVSVDGKPVVRRMYRDLRFVAGIHEAEALAQYLTDTVAEMKKLTPTEPPNE